MITAKRFSPNHLGKAACCLALALLASSTHAQAGATAGVQANGQHDFDFNEGHWRSRITRFVAPLGPTPSKVELAGTVDVRKVWDGRAWLEEIEAEGPAGHWQALTLFLYNPVARQWSQTFINSRAGTLSQPLIGSRREGRVELAAQDTLGDRSILVRAAWTIVDADAHRYEELYSDDAGKTWSPAFVADLTRRDAAAMSAEPQGLTLAGPERGGVMAPEFSHDFDFDLGRWKTTSRRLLRPLTGSNTWVDMEGITDVRPIWGGRANLAEFRADGSAGLIELLSLRWYNPSSKEWSLGFATPSVGVLGAPSVGRFREGRGVFYSLEMIGGRSVLVRFSIWPISRDTAQSEQAFSVDGGATWETNWINRYVRLAE